MVDLTTWSNDPALDWPSRFAPGDFVRLEDGRPAIVRLVQDYAAQPPARWELVVSTLTDGNPDDVIVEPWSCVEDVSARAELDGRL